MTTLALVLTIVVLQRLSELVLARINYHWAMRRGGREYGAEHYWLFIVLHTLWLVGITVEWLVLRPAVPVLWPFFALLIGAAQILRYWVIHTLGRCWNTRIVVFEQMSMVTSGPYRFLRHPNYVAVALEIIAIPALLGAWYTALAFSMANAALLMLIRIPEEERVLEKHLQRGN